MHSHNFTFLKRHSVIFEAMLKKYIAYFMLLFVAVSANAQQPDADGSLVKWMTLPEALEKVKTQPKPIILDFYTDWCGWCKRMMATTYANPGLAQYINTNFYPVKFNAEGKDTINYLGTIYAPTSTAPRSTHPLAAKLLQGKMMYPTTLFMNGYDKTKNEFQFNMLASGYLEDKKIEPILIFTLENVFRNCAYEDFKTQFDIAFNDSTTNNKLKDVKLLTPKDAFKTGDVSGKKKTLVFIHTEWCNSCRVMQRATFIDSALSPYLKSKFDIVDFNPEITDSITYKGQLFTNPRSPQMPFHQLALAFSRNNFVLPTVAVLDENGQLLDTVPFYMHPNFLGDVAHYYGDDIHKTKKWPEYIAAKNKPAVK